MLLGFLSQFAAPFLTCLVLAVGVASTAIAVAARRGDDGRRRLRLAARVLAVGAALVVVIATNAPDSWPPSFSGDGDLVLSLGRGGLREWRVLLEEPDSLAAVLLVANVLLYVPLGFFARIGWQRTLPVLLCAALLSALVEALQWQALGRVGSTDDFLLNFAGALVGLILALPMTKHLSRRR